MENPALDPSVQSLFAFEHMEVGIPFLQESDTKRKLLQWNLDKNLRIERFRVTNRKIIDGSEKELFNSFLNDDTVKSLLSMDPLSLEEFKKIKFKKLQLTATSMSFFDKLIDSKLISESGSIRRCIDEIYDGATASDLVKEMLINPDSENCDVFSSNDKEEFLFHLFQLLVIGGSMCQSDDDFGTYEHMIKNFYKSLISVKKNPSDPSIIDITSQIYELEATALFSTKSRFNHCYIVLDKKKRMLTVLHNCFQSFWS